MTPERFKQERKYLKNVTPKTLAWYDDSFKAFQGALGGKGPSNGTNNRTAGAGCQPCLD